MALVTSLIYDVAEELLDCIAARLAEEGIDVPARQYVHQGEVAMDSANGCCLDALVVSVGGLTHALPGDAADRRFFTVSRTVQLDVWLIRCVPTLDGAGRSPSADALNAAAERTLADMWVLSNAIVDGYLAKCWGTRCASVLFGDVVPYGPEGGCGGSHAQVFLDVVFTDALENS